MHNKLSNRLVREGKVALNDAALHYLVYGNGEKTIICFHGHGKSAKDFSFLSADDRRIISVNLFFHGESKLPLSRVEKNPISPKELVSLFEVLLEKENVDKFHLVAYSQGGRFGLCLFPHFINRIKSAYFMAIDGMNDNNIYSRAPRRKSARALFKYWTQKPKSMLFTAGVLAKLSIIHPKLLEILEYYASDKERFLISYYAWAAFRKLRTDEQRLKQLLQENKVIFKVVTGEFDKIITTKTAQGFLERINQPKALITIPWGHDFFKDEAKELLLPILKFP